MTSSQGAPGRGTAVVIGGGLAGTLAAWALRGHAERIVVVERDRYPAERTFRAGLPQGRHAHLILEAGHRALEELMPGTRQELLDAGAVRVALSGDLRWLSSAGWMAEYVSRLAFLSCTRPVLDGVVLDRVRTEPTIEFLEGTEVVGLLGTAAALTGVQVRERGADRGEARDLPAELVVDASGRSTALAGWLQALGARPVPEERVDAGATYSSRLFHRPAGADLGCEAIYLQTKAPDSPRLGVLLPVEGDRWIVSLAGMRGAEPEPGEAGFAKHLAQLRDPAIREALAAAEPAGDVRGFVPGPGVRRHYERSSPDGLVVVGDAACTFNPVYGQGVTVAVFGARELRRSAEQNGGIGHAAARSARRAVAAVSKNPWVMSSTEDVRFKATTGGPSGALLRAQHRFLDRVLVGAAKDPAVAKAFHEVLSLVAPPTALFRPAVLGAILRSR
ncbi:MULTISPECIES: NAD(P)/FAD-dependent oxidoreductase [Kitasatospora]|uniref:2-polyprenyl-6-methoxyphenol hydroxylase-like FAD-dependent oxidoreductase n=2 Tax=Kitasatospora TaxID=2063 RepID=A0ABT1J190_9ACTN|nr:FAD-dependent monooxygenase [Kitasatospora paracochleata]MCP2311200.1 2-polyprenyl-6-methoxyphenol hydroxylase-like FAD-dependent oxidoreductase [Kitasatospora paracochleata]